MTGRPVNHDHAAKPYEADPEASRIVRHDNAVRMKDVLVRHGRGDVPVFEGGIAPYSLVPHGVHIDEHVLDLAPPLLESQLAGGIAEAAHRIAGLPDGTRVDLICAGPLTDARALMNDPRVRPKLGVLTAQLGMFGSDRVTMMGGGRRQFNVAADSDATRAVLAGYPGPIYIVPTDITKSPEFSFADPGDVATLSDSPAFAGLAEMYLRAYPIMWEPRGEKIYFHDFHPVELMANLDSMQPPHQVASDQPQQVGRYTMTRVSVAHVPSPGPDNDWSDEPRWGEIDLQPTPDPHGPQIYLATAIDTDPRMHRRILAKVLNAPPTPAQSSCSASGTIFDKSLGLVPRDQAENGTRTAGESGTSFGHLARSGIQLGAARTTALTEIGRLNNAVRTRLRAVREHLATASRHSETIRSRNMPDTVDSHMMAATEALAGAGQAIDTAMQHELERIEGTRY